MKFPKDECSQNLHSSMQGLFSAMHGPTFCHNFLLMQEEFLAQVWDQHGNIGSNQGDQGIIQPPINPNAPSMHTGSTDYRSAAQLYSIMHCLMDTHFRSNAYLLCSCSHHSGTLAHQAMVQKALRSCSSQIGPKKKYNRIGRPAACRVSVLFGLIMCKKWVQQRILQEET